MYMYYTPPVVSVKPNHLLNPSPEQTYMYSRCHNKLSVTFCQCFVTIVSPFVTVPFYPAACICEHSRLTAKRYCR